MLARSLTLTSLALSLLCLTAGGCRDRERAGANEAGEVAGDPIPAVPADLQQMLATLGDRGVVVVVLRDTGWREGVGALIELLGADSPLLPAASSPVELLHVLGTPHGAFGKAGELRGRDPSRPIVASLLEAPV